MLTIESRFDVVASSSFSGLDGSDPQVTRKTTRRVLNHKNKDSCKQEKTTIAGLEGEIIEMKQEIAGLEGEISELKQEIDGDNGEIVGGDDDDDDNDDTLFLTATYYRPHYGCGTDGTTPQAVKAFVENQMKSIDVTGSDFIGLSEFEASTVIEADDFGYNYDMIAAMCRGDGPVDEASPIRLYYDSRRWTLDASYPPSNDCQRKYEGGAPTKTHVAPWNCGYNQMKPNTSEGKCCSCTYSEEEAGGLGGRTWVAGILTTTQGTTTHTVCVVTANMARIGRPSTGTIAPEVATFCGSHSIVFMADTNMANPSDRTSDLFEGMAPLNTLRDTAYYDTNGYTCCANNDKAGDPKLASDRIGTTGSLEIRDLKGGTSTPLGSNFPEGFGYQCLSPEEHYPISALISNTHIRPPGPIPITDLKCFPSSILSGYNADCFNGEVDPRTGFWVFGFNNSGPSDPSCSSLGPGTCTQFCEECAGGPAMESCACDGAYFCKPYVL